MSTLFKKTTLGGRAISAFRDEKKERKKRRGLEDDLATLQARQAPLQRAAAIGQRNALLSGQAPGSTLLGG
jgi:hypothetical protein